MCNTQHGEQCLKAKEQAEAWTAAHPNACPKCHGAGGKDHYSWADGHDYEYCSACVEQCKCPLCGAQHADDWIGEHCNACGWDWEDDSAGGEWECTCYDSELNAVVEYNRSYEIETEEEETMTDDGAAIDFAYDAFRERQYR